MSRRGEAGFIRTLGTVALVGFFAASSFVGVMGYQYYVHRSDNYVQKRQQLEELIRNMNVMKNAADFEEVVNDICMQYEEYCKTIKNLNMVCPKCKSSAGMFSVRIVKGKNFKQLIKCSDCGYYTDEKYPVSPLHFTRVFYKPSNKAYKKTLSKIIAYHYNPTTEVDEAIAKLQEKLKQYNRGFEFNFFSSEKS